MSYIADAHRDWHVVHGAPGKSDEVCPLDCWDPPYDPEPETGEGIRCGKCRSRHWDVADVKACHAVAV